MEIGNKSFAIKSTDFLAARTMYPDARARLAANFVKNTALTMRHKSAKLAIADWKAARI